MASSKSLTIAERLTEQWLVGEHTSQFGKSTTTFSGDPQNSIGYILEVEIPHKWDRYRILRKYELEQPEAGLQLRRRAAQHIMQICGTARAAYVWEQVVGGNTIAGGSERSWQALRTYYANLSTGATTLPPAATLSAPLGTAIPEYRVTPAERIRSVFIRTVGLALTHLLDQNDRTGTMLLPQPGLPSGDVREWNVREL